MISRDNDGGGTTIFLAEGDLLTAVPESHADILTPELRNIFANPIRFFETIAARTEIVNFRRYLNAMTSGGEWRLVLADTYMPVRSTIAGLRWTHPTQSSALISPPSSNPVTGPFSALHNDVGAVHWSRIGWGGGLFSFADHIRLDHYGIKSQDARFPLTSTRAFGSSSCGDVMVYNAEGLAGFLSHETGTVHAVGTVLEMLEWVFSELAENRMPEIERCIANTSSCQFVDETTKKDRSWRP